MTIDVTKLAFAANIDFELHESIGREPVWIATQDELERFAALVMEEAAKVCEARNTGDCSREDQESTLCAEAIRARKPA